jgi:DNA mismatch endonuclease (patch repair protein)
MFYAQGWKGVTSLKTPSYDGLAPASAQASRAKQHNQAVDTRHEKVLRSALWKLGCRYRKNVRALPGKPDIVFVVAKLVVFCDGDFWHGRNWNALRKHLRVGANASYWTAKIARNKERDRIVTTRLQGQGWRVLRFWETDILANPDAAARVVNRVLHAIR